MHVVAKNFKTVNRRFKAGDPVVPEDIQGEASFDDWKTRGFIAPAKPERAPFKLNPKPEPAPKPVEE